MILHPWFFSAQKLLRHDQGHSAVTLSRTMQGSRKSHRPEASFRALNLILLSSWKPWQVTTSLNVISLTCHEAMIPFQQDDLVPSHTSIPYAKYNSLFCPCHTPPSICSLAFSALPVPQKTDLYRPHHLALLLFCF